MKMSHDDLRVVKEFSRRVENNAHIFMVETCKFLSQLHAGGLAAIITIAKLEGNSAHYLALPVTCFILGSITSLLGLLGYLYGTELVLSRLRDDYRISLEGFRRFASDHAGLCIFGSSLCFVGGALMLMIQVL